MKERFRNISFQGFIVDFLLLIIVGTTSFVALSLHWKLSQSILASKADISDLFFVDLYASAAVAQATVLASMTSGEGWVGPWRFWALANCLALLLLFLLWLFTSFH